MARIRSIKHEFFYSEQVTSCSPYARLFFIGLWTLADRDGRLQWAPKKLKPQLFPYSGDPEHPDAAVQIYVLAEELTAAGLLHIYEIDKQAYAWIPGFTKHQRPHPKEPASTIPVCPEGHPATDIPWNRTPKPCNATASRETPGDIPLSPARKGMDKGNGSLDYGSLEKGNGNPRPAPLVMSPLAYERELEFHAYVGARLRVPRKLHADFRRDLGGEEPEARLMAWYAELDAEVERTREAINIPDKFKWLQGRFEAFCAEAVRDAELQKFREANRGH